MKDFYEIWILTKTFDFVEERLTRAIAATFARRQTAIPVEAPDALTPAFADDPLKQRQWAAFAADLTDVPAELKTVVDELMPFLMNIASKARQQAK